MRRSVKCFVSAENQGIGQGMAESWVLHKCGLIPSVVVHRGGNTNMRDSILCGGIRMYFCNI